MSDLQVSEWKRYGHDRLYVNRASGEKVAWFDRRTGQLNILVEEYRPAVLEVLAPYLAPYPAGAGGSSPEAVPVAPAPAADRNPPWAQDDLTANQPGQAVRAKRDELAPGFLGLIGSMLLGRRSEAHSWRLGLIGERKVGAELERLTSKGWRVLHSIPLPRDVDIDHLLIGPGGVFCVNTKYHRGARVWVGDDSVKIGGQSYPYVRKSRAEAKRASSMLTQACGFTVDVRPVLAFVGVEKLTVLPSLLDVRVLQHRELSAFKRATGVWTPTEVATIHASAKDRRTWLNR